MFNTLYLITLNIIVSELTVEYLSVPRVIVFPGVPVLIKDVYDPVDPDDTRTMYIPLSIECRIDEAAESAERNGYTTYEDEYVDIELF